MQANPWQHIWQSIRQEVEDKVKEEPILASFFHATILNHSTLAQALSFHLANKLDSPCIPAILLREVFDEALSDETIIRCVADDLQAVFDRDSACDRYSTPFLYFKGFQALQSHRIAHWLWHHKRTSLALHIQHVVSVNFGIDIHPAAQMGSGIMLDHGTGVVIGETCVIGNNVSIMQAVTLGGTGKEEGDRHPKIGDGVLISCGAKILGNLRIGTGAKVGAGSVVLQDVADHVTVAGVPAKVVGCPQDAQPALDMNHGLNCDMQ